MKLILTVLLLVVGLAGCAVVSEPSPAETAAAREAAIRQAELDYITAWNLKAATLKLLSSYEVRPRLLFAPRPVYPPDMREQGRQASVMVQIVVDEDGRVSSAVPVDAAAQPVPFVAAALAAVRQWHFQPALWRGRPVEAHMIVPLAFTLD